MTFFKDEFEAKVCIADMMDEVTYGQAEALSTACARWDAFDKIKELFEVDADDVYEAVQKLKNEISVTRNYLHDHNLEWDLLSYTYANSNKVQQEI